MNWSYITRELSGGIISALVISCVANPSNAQPLPPTGGPTTVQQTVHDILARMTPDEQAEIRDIRREDIIRYHLIWGTGIERKNA